ncbi:MAG: hypothetical protein ACFCVH_13625 [Alphaproteobacteria bacterium]
MTNRRRRAVLKAGLGIGAAGLLHGCGAVAVERSAVAGEGRIAGAAQVPTIAALRSMRPETASVVEVAGYYRPEDGGGGLFTWVAQHGEADDCGLVIAPDAAQQASGRWLREAGGELEFAWFGPHADGTQDDAPALERALDCAARTGSPLRIGRGTYHLKSDVHVEIGSDQVLDVRGDGAVFQRSGRGGIVYFDAVPVDLTPVVESIRPGEDGITVGDAGKIAVGDLVAVASGIRMAESGSSSWIAAEYGRVVAIRGNRLILDGPTHSTVHPNRRLAYRMDGQSSRLHYRLFWGGEAQDVRVSLDGRALQSGAEFTVSGEVYRGFDIAFTQVPAAGSEVVLTTANPIYAKVFRGGQLTVSGLRFESDFAAAGPVTFVSSVGLAPAGSRFSDLELIERNAPLDGEGYRQGVEGDLFRVGLINSSVENVRIQGGRYALQAIAGRNITYRGIYGEGCWHVVSSSNADTVNIFDVTAVRCVSAIDSHYAHIQNVDGVEGVGCDHGMNHRANGGVLRNAVLLDNTDRSNPGLNVGVGQGEPVDDRLLADPRDNPRVIFGAGPAAVAIERCRFGAPRDPNGFCIHASYLRRFSLTEVETDGLLVIDGDGPPPLGELIIDRFNCRSLIVRGVTDVVSARKVRTGQLSLRGSVAPLMRFEDCIFDGAIDGSDTLIVDGEVSGSLACRFVNCTFRNAARLIDPDRDGGNTPLRHFTFEGCVFEVGDRNGF